MNKTDTRVFALLIIAGLSALTAACQQPRQDEQKKERAVIGVAAIILSAPVIIAQEKGFFVQEGLDAVIREYPFGKPALEAMLDGKVDMATVAETPVVFQSFRRDDFSVAATFVYSYDDSKIVFRKDSGITSASDLRGKRIGTALGTSAHFFLESFLLYNGIHNSEVNITSFSAKDLPQALANNTVDAIATFEPYAYEALQNLKEKAARLPESGIYRETFNITVMNKFSKEHPEAVKRALRAIDRAVAFIKQNRAESIAVISGRLQMDRELLNALWDDYKFGLSLDQPLLVTFEEEARWIVNNKLTEETEIPDYLHYIYFDALSEINPDAVTMIR